jgi:uncharacterized membrane protein
MQTEEQDGQYLERTWENASLFPHISQQGQQDNWTIPLEQFWRDESSVPVNDVQDVYKSLPVTPTVAHMPDRPPLFALPTLTTPTVSGDSMPPAPPETQQPISHEGVTGEMPAQPTTGTDTSPNASIASDRDASNNIVEQAMARLNDAARRISAVEKRKSRHSPKASRLSPYRDISGEIQRHSTPMPVSPSTPNGYTSQATGSRFLEMWPWLADMEENEQDVWANHTDPLIRRHFPDSAETARLEEEDVRRARAEGFRVSLGRGRVRTRRLRFLFACLAVLAIAVLLVDVALVSFALARPHHATPVVSGLPTLTITAAGQQGNQVKYGQNITMHLRHFSPSSKVWMTHDVEEPVLLGGGTSLILVDAAGSADITTVIDPSSWNPGFHTIDAEDVVSHYTANAMLQITGSGATRPSHLLIKTTSLDFGAGIQGSNTIQPLTLSNTGSGAINWAASSDQPWLILTPNQGTFSSNETLEIAVQRGTLTPKDYTGKITFSSNVGSSITVSVQMTVNPIPPNAGPVLMITPAVLSFTAQDLGANPTGQELVVGNPGTKPLSWSLSNSGLTQSANQSQILNDIAIPTSNWLSISPASGTVLPGTTGILQVNVNSQNLLPGTYIDTVVFSGGANALNNTQSVSISLTILPQCGLTLSTGAMSFTSVANQSDSTVQALNLSTTSACGAISWHASSSANWLQLTPTSGQANATTSSVISVSVNASGMSAGTYPGTITVMAGTSTQSVLVSLQVQPPPPPGAPVMSASPLTMTFTAIAGQSKSDGQVVVISNTGQSMLQWHTQVSLLSNSWLGASPTGGTIAPGQTAQVLVTVNPATANLTPGDYNGQVTIIGTDTSVNQNAASGSPQNIAVLLHVLPPCGLQAPSSSALAFTVMQGGTSATAQPVTFTASGNCNWPVNWQASLSSHALWLTLSSLSGVVSASGQVATLSVNVNTSGLAPGTYTTQISLAASDSTPVAAQGSPEVISVTLTIQQPCQLQVSTNALTFSTTTGQTSDAQSVAFSETGTCASPVSWSVSADAGSAAWLVLSPSSGSDTGSGSSVAVSVNAGSLAPGTYKGTITLTASGAGGAAMQGSPFTISVNATVTGFSVSGVVNACATSACSTPLPLVGASVSLLNASGTPVATAVTGAGGAYSLANVPAGTYTVSVSGTDTSGTHYIGTAPVTVTGNTQNVTVSVLPG